MSTRPFERTCEIARQQQSFEDARRFAEQSLDDSHAACREAVAMAVQEFAENLSKYGAADGTAGTITVCMTEDGVRIRVRNVACSRDDGEQVEATIAEINAAPDVTELYRGRQRELFRNPNLARVRLGLLRVAFEGGFRLSCVYAHPLLEIFAEREGCCG